MKIQALQTDMFEDLNKIFKNPFPRLIHLNGKDILFRNEVEQIELAHAGMPAILRLPSNSLEMRRDLFIAMLRPKWPNRLSPSDGYALREMMEITQARA